ncbi:MAG TPA: YceI family protein [Paracoccaceae bacterium]|nr:YceI family protein [Paracoccaceae bacterium]HMO71827.1 YceI family protein [Paracoccaceae bacterium]
MTRPSIPAAALVALLAAPAAAAPQAYVLDPSHSQIVLSCDNLGQSTSWGMFSGSEGHIAFDAENPSASSVEVAFPVRSMLTGWEARFRHCMSPDFLDAADDVTVRLVSTGIEVTGEAMALITGDLTLNGVTKAVVLDARLNKAGTHPMEGKPRAGFSATAPVLRSEFGLGAFAPFIGDEVAIRISVGAMAE